MLLGPGDVALESRAPDPQPGDVVVRLAASSICGTDLSIVKGSIPVTPRRVLGHEGAGTVETSGRGGALEQGRPVVVDPVIACGSCPFCLEGRPNLCPAGGLLGRDLDGLFADHVAVPERNLHALPDGVPLELAPTVQVLATVVRAHAAIEVEPGSVGVVIGLGFTGQLHAQLLQHRGARVLGVGTPAETRGLAAHLGCAWTAAPEDAPAALAEVAPDGAHIVVEAVGSVATLRQALALVRPGGTILAFGTQTATRAELPLYDLYYKEVSVISTRASRPTDMDTALALVARGQVDLAPLVSDRLRLDDVSEALARARRGAGKVVMTHT